MIEYREDAWIAVKNAIDTGILVPLHDQVCAYCDDHAVYYHHGSYETHNILDVIPVCRKCHRELHGSMKIVTKRKYVHIRVKEDTHQRFKLLAVDAGQTIDDFANSLMDTYERSRAISRGFGRTPLPMPETSVAP
jgi:hypothetical protein